MAPFKDPNVLGSYIVTGVLYLVQRLLLGRSALPVAGAAEPRADPRRAVPVLFARLLGRGAGLSG